MDSTTSSIPNPSKPRRGRPRVRERSSTDFVQQQPGDIAVPGLGETLDRTPDVIMVDGKALQVTKDYLDLLQFNNELVEIMIHPPAEEAGSPTTDLVAIGGKWAEIMVDSRHMPCGSKEGNGRMLEWGYLPRGEKLVTRRKYVEELAKARHTTIRTEILEPKSERPHNIVRRMANLKFPFQVFNDHHPKAEAWLHRILS